MKPLKSLLSFTLPELLKFSSIRSVCLLAFYALLTILSACTSADDSSDPAFTVELSGTALTETETLSPLTIITTASGTLSATLAACADFSGITFTVTDPATGYTAALDTTASSDYNYDDPNANTQTINVIITDTELDTEAAIIPITVTLQGCYRVTISSSALTSDTDPLIVSSDQTSAPTATLDPCADFSGITFDVTEPATGYIAAFASTASSDYDYDDPNANTPRTIDVIITADGQNTAAANIPIEVTILECSISVEIAGSAELSNDADGNPVSSHPVTVMTGQSSATAFTLTACADFSAITFTVTDPAAGYTAALHSSASSAYNYDDPNANTPRTIDVIITADGQSTAAAIIPITVTLQICYRVTITSTSSDLSPNSLTVSSGQTSTPTATLDPCADFSGITFDVTEPATGYTAAFASSASSDYDYDNPNANTQDIDVIITTAGQSTAAAIIPISVSLQGCFRVTITSSTLTPNSLAVSSDQANIPTATLDPCVDFSDIIFTVTDPAADYTAALVGNPYYSTTNTMYSTTNTMLSAIAITTDGQSTSVATIAIQVQLSECNNFADGDGTSTTTAWEINNDMRLDLMSRLVASSSSYRDDYYKVTANIDLGQTSAPWAENTGGSGFTPIGTTDLLPFTGNMNCANYTISNLYINRSSEDNIGLFGVITNNNAIVANCTLSDAKVTGNNSVGGIVGFQADGTISSNTVSGGAITATTNYAGGIVGYQSNGTTSDNTNSGGAITATNNHAGGIVGYQSNGTISNNTVSNATIIATSYAGGLVGKQYSGTISSNTVSGDSAITASGTAGGGLVGEQYSGTISNNTVSNGAITANTYAGGLVGLQSDATDGITDGTISSNTVSDSSITANGIDAGGIVGRQSNGTISDNTVSGDSSITATTNAGGLVGRQNGGTNSSNTVSNATITANDITAGGIVGAQWGGTISSNTVSGDSSITAANDYAGGIAGVQNNGTISSNTVSGSAITATSTAGGIVGVQGYGTISHNFSAALVRASSNYSGGLAGYANSALSNNAFIGVVCTDTTSGTASGGVSSLSTSLTPPSPSDLELSDSYTAAKVTGNTILGLAPSSATVSTSYWDNTLNSSTSGEGTGQSSADLQTPTTATGIYSSWSSTVWDFGISSDYPALNGLLLTAAEQRTAGTAALALSCPTDSP